MVWRVSGNKRCYNTWHFFFIYDSSNHVWFQYNSNNGMVLKGINLTIIKGEVVALVGSSGAGKSTLVDMIPRFHDITKGSINIDSYDIRDITLNSLRRQIGRA